MISVEEARSHVLAGVCAVGIEQVGLMEALGRVLAEDVEARVDHPPADVSAMDGYAVRAADAGEAPVTLRLAGESAAGRGFDGIVGPGEAVRIFTGAPMPAGADAVIMQEDATRNADGTVAFSLAAKPGRHVRRRAMDFGKGDALLPARRLLSARDVALAAAMNVPWLKVRRRPRVAILSTGDEIVMPGEPLSPGQIVGCNGLGLAAFVAACGGVPMHLGIALDTRESLREVAEGARGADLLVSSGGVSVGEYDLVQSALGESGLEIGFYKVAMRPGKPLMFGRFGDIPMLGVPGNPVSALVCAALFLGPALRHMVGLPPDLPTLSAALACDLAGNDHRQDHLRARLARRPDGSLMAIPFAAQDSAMLAGLAAADGLIVRPPHAPPATTGDAVTVIPLAGGI